MVILRGKKGVGPFVATLLNGGIIFNYSCGTEGPTTGANGPEFGVLRVVILRGKKGVGPIVATLLNGGI